MLKQNIEELEQRKVELFRLKDMLTIRKRELSKEIKDAKEKLKYELELEKEFGVMCNNLNLGRGKYYDLTNLAFEIQSSMDSPEYEKLSIEEKEKVKANLEFAKKIRDDIETEYQELIESRPDRLKKIKDMKRKLVFKKRELTLSNREEKKKILKAKRIDKRISALKEKQPTNKVVFKLK